MSLYFSRIITHHALGDGGGPVGLGGPPLGRGGPFAASLVTTMSKTTMVHVSTLMKETTCIFRYSGTTAHLIP